jgi:citrate lyase subunit beta / citryl-CoA lyase
MALRSLLFVPGDNEHNLAGAARHGADALILDLEDSVATSRKAVARGLVNEYLRAAARANGPRCMVRLNGIQTGLTWDDLAAVLPARPDAVLLPKGDPGLLAELDRRLSELEQRAGMQVGMTPVYVLATETARGVFTVGQFTGVSARLQGLSWGHEDLAAELGAVNRDTNGDYTDVFRMARSLCLLGAAAAGVDAIDGAFMDFRNLDAFARECDAGRRDGFTGKLAIHPAQVALINSTFTPSAAEVRWARRVVAAFTADPQLGVIAVDGKVVDRPHLRLAERLLARL